MTDLCPCGEPLHYARDEDRADVQSLVDRFGPTVLVRTPFGSWYVPRHYVALHGTLGRSLAALAAQYGWEKA